MKTWNDGRPDNVCQKCGYATCCCHLQRRYQIAKAKAGRPVEKEKAVPEGII